MRKWRLARQVTTRETTLLAFLAAVVIHAFFLLPGYRTVDTGPDRQTPGVEILNMSSLSAREYRDLKNWISIHDPARAARSSSASGYTAQLPLKTHYSVPVEPFVEETLRTLPPMRPFTPLSGSAPLSARAPEPEYIPKKAAAPLKAAVFDGNGNKLDLAPTLPPGAGSRTSTIVSLRKTGKVFVASVIQSSGDHQLDRIAVNAVLTRKTADGALFVFVWPEVKK